jgi:hypothetical protein
MSFGERFSENTLRANLCISKVPEHDHDGLILWITKGILPGDFLTAVLENNLMEAFGRADEVNQAHLFDICFFLYNHAPGGCHGSRKTMLEWMAAQRIRAANQAAESPGASPDEGQPV